jgi:Fic-DOC domain mobile mystery protein B
VGLNRKLIAAELLNAPGQTPLTEEDLEGIIPDHIDSREQLNQWEAENIKEARKQLAVRRLRLDVLSVDGLQELHSMMFGATWRWAGEFSRTMNQFSDTRTPRNVQLRELVENTKETLLHANNSPDEQDHIAVRFHHQLTRIHPWRNGNGRHARQATDELLTSLDRPPFTWGSGADLIAAGEVRGMYIRALRQADGGDLSRLRAFVRT